MNRYINESDKKMDELLQKYIAGNASEKESQRIMEWLREDEQHLREYKRQRKLYDITLWQTKSPVDIQQEKKRSAEEGSRCYCTDSGCHCFYCGNHLFLHSPRFTRQGGEYANGSCSGRPACRIIPG